MTWLALVGGPQREQVTALQTALLYLAIFFLAIGMPLVYPSVQRGESKKLHKNRREVRQHCSNSLLPVKRLFSSSGPGGRLPH